MPVRTDNPREVGQDRVVNAVAASSSWAARAWSSSFGTSTNFDVVSADGAFLGGVIAQGVEVSMDTLYARPAPGWARWDSWPPPTVIGRSTIACIHSSAVYGFAGQVDGIMRRIYGELGGPCPTIATGGPGRRCMTAHAETICRPRAGADPRRPAPDLESASAREPRVAAGTSEAPLKLRLALAAALAAVVLVPASASSATLPGAAGSPRPEAEADDPERPEGLRAGEGDRARGRLRRGEQWVYAGFTATSRPDVLVPITSGGTAGIIAFYVYSYHFGDLRNLLVRNEVYKVGLRVKAGNVVVTYPLYRANSRTAARPGWSGGRCASTACGSCGSRA